MLSLKPASRFSLKETASEGESVDSFEELLPQVKQWLSEQVQQPSALSLTSQVEHNTVCSAKALGRIALQQAFAALSLPLPTEPIRWPLAYGSLSHCLPYAVAIAVDTSPKPSIKNTLQLKGLGVDLELWRDLPPNSDLFFLTPAERSTLDALKLSPKARAKERLRLWCLKEAVFKACTPNSGLELLDFELQLETHLETTAQQTVGFCLTQEKPKNTDNTEENKKVFKAISFTCKQGVLALSFCLSL